MFLLSFMCVSLCKGIPPIYYIAPLEHSILYLEHSEEFEGVL